MYVDVDMWMEIFESFFLKDKKIQKNICLVWITGKDFYLLILKGMGCLERL